MRISDWSSDVCSSDLHWAPTTTTLLISTVLHGKRKSGIQTGRTAVPSQTWLQPAAFAAFFRSPASGLSAADRKSVVSGKSVSVRVDIGGRRIIKKKK